MKLYVSTPDFNGCLTVIDLAHRAAKNRLSLVSSRKLKEQTKASYIQKMLRFSHKGVKYLVLGRRGGTLEVYTETAIPGEADVDLKPLGRWDGNTKDDKDFFVSLIFWNDNLCSCSNRGLLVMRNLDVMVHSTEVSEQEMNTFYVQLNEPITVFKPHSVEKWWAITGGYSNNLRIYNFTNIYQSFVAMVRTGPQFSKAVLSARPIWKASLYWSFNQPIEEFPWIQEVIFLEQKADASSTEICCTTKFGQLLLYDSSHSYYPISATTVSNHPVCYVSQISPKFVLFADCADTVGVFDLSSQKVRNTFRIPTGSLSSMEARVSATDSSLVYLMVVSILKVLRIYRLDHFGGGADLLLAIDLGSTGLQLLTLAEDSWDAVDTCRSLTRIPCTVVGDDF